jgi:hypothetical protein
MPFPSPADGDASAEIAPSRVPSRHRAAAFLPQLVLRFTYRGSASRDVAVYDQAADAWRWPVPYGIGLELRAVWSLDRLLDTIPLLDDDNPEPLEEIDP